MNVSVDRLDVPVTDGDAVVLDPPEVESFPLATVDWVDGDGHGSASVVRRRGSARHHVTCRDQLVLLDIRYETHQYVVYRATATNRFTLHTTATPLYLLRVQLPPPHRETIHYTPVCCVMFAESEPYCHSILFFCLSVIPRPTVYHN